MKTEVDIEQLNRTLSKKNQRKRHDSYLEFKNNWEKMNASCYFDCCSERNK